MSEAHPWEGFWKSYSRIRNEGEIVNQNRLHRVYKGLGLSLGRKSKNRLPARVKEPLENLQTFSHIWSIDFMTDALSNGQKFRTFNVLDDYIRQVLFIESDDSLKRSMVIWILHHLVNRFGRRERTRMDNWPDFIGRLATEWSRMDGIEFHYIQPGKPTQNAYVERLNNSSVEAADLFHSHPLRR